MSSAVDPAIAGAVNFRDVGGLQAEGGRTRGGVLYRSGNLAQLDDEGAAALTALGLKRIIDLRADDEVTSAPSRIEGSATRVHRVPLFLGSVTSFFEDDLSLDEMYDRLVEDSAAGVVEVVRGIVADQPVLVHCTVGKDRTGVTVALALAAAGVTADEVVADYARTEAQLPPWRNQRIVERLRQLHPGAVHLEDLATRSPAPVMQRMLERVAAQHGSAAGYLREHGMPEDELVELRRVLVAK